MTDKQRIAVESALATALMSLDALRIEVRRNCVPPNRERFARELLEMYRRLLDVTDEILP